MFRKILLLAALSLSACGSEPPMRFETRAEQPTEKVRIRYNTVSVREVSLPTYAATEEIAQAGADGSVQANADTLWADDPVRAVTLDVSRALRRITGARVAPDPWPFQGRPAVTVDIRFEELLPSSSGQFRASGLYFVAPDEEGGREHAHEFDFAVSFDGEAGIGALAMARGQIVNQLALDIARTALR